MSYLWVISDAENSLAYHPLVLSSMIQMTTAAEYLSVNPTQLPPQHQTLILNQEQHLHQASTLLYPLTLTQTLTQILTLHLTLTHWDLPQLLNQRVRYGLA